MNLAWTTALALTLAVGPGSARAREAGAPGESNRAILEIVDSRARRLPDLERYKAGGVVGENNRGRVEILKPFKDPAKLERLERVVEGENADRERLYAALAAGDPAEADNVRESYAELLRTSARPGEWIQLPDGKWRKKK